MNLTECSDFPNDCGQLSANIEIEGVGVYISFLATALLTLLAALLRLPCQFALRPHEFAERIEPEYHDFDHTSEKGTPATLYHAAKQKVRFYRRWIFSKYINKANQIRYRLLNAALTPLILSLADQQLVTSSAVMIAGRYNWDTISAYHYNIIVYLAWFSTFTHTVALVSMSDHYLQNRVLARIRLCGYMANFLLYIYAQHYARNFQNTTGLFLLKTRNSGAASGEAAACLAKCAATIPYIGYDHQFRIALMALLFFQAFLQCIPQCIRSEFSLTIYSWCLKIFCIASQERLCLWLGYVLQAVIISFWMLPIIPILLALTSSVVGALLLRSGSEYPGLELAEDFIEQQNAWTFGQFAACILLILPVMAALEGFFKEREKIYKENHAAGLPSHSSQWKHRVNMLLKFTHLGKPPTANDEGLRNRMSTWADNNSVDHPLSRETERSDTLQIFSAQSCRLSKPCERQMSHPVSPKLFTHDSGEPVLLPYSKSSSPGLESVRKPSK